MTETPCCKSLIMCVLTPSSVIEPSLHKHGCILHLLHSLLCAVFMKIMQYCNHVVSHSHDQLTKHNQAQLDLPGY